MTLLNLSSYAGGGGESLKGISDEERVTSNEFNKRELTQLSHSELVSESIPRSKLAVLACKILKPSWIMRHCPKAWFWASYGFRFAHPTANPLQDDSYDNTHNSLVTSFSLLVTRMQAKLAFTMAEILLSLTIIGVVAAITLPSLTGNINERTWNTQRKALFSRMSQAISLMDALNGYGRYKAPSGDPLQDALDTAAGNGPVDNAAETFVTVGLAKVLKINNICGTNIQDCGLPTSFNDMQGNPQSFALKISEFNDQVIGAYCTGGREINLDVDTKVAAFETQNGESVAVYYNPRCLYKLLGDEGDNTDAFVTPKICANFVYDLNGTKGPNTAGKDIGSITVFYPADSVVVAPMPVTTNASGTYTAATMSAACSDKDETRLPNSLELSSLFYNQLLYGMPDGVYYSGSKSTEGVPLTVQIITGAGHWQNPGAIYPAYTTGGGSSSAGVIRCVKR